MGRKKKHKNNNINLFFKKNKKYMKFFLTVVLVPVFIIACGKIYYSIPDKRVSELWEKSKNIQNETSFIIDSQYVLTYKRLDGTTDVYKNNIKFYKSGNKWRSDNIEVWDGVKHVFVSVFDGKDLHDYVNVEDENHTGKYNPVELSINKGMIIYDQNREYGYSNESLEDVIEDFNKSNKILNWYYSKWNGIIDKENPRVVRKTVINDFPCTYIKFRPRREACISEEYGIAVYWKESVDESKYLATANKESIHEYYVQNIRNSAKDIVHINNSLFDLPDIVPIHVYGKY